jgi:hypothetical protein
VGEVWGRPLLVGQIVVPLGIIIVVPMAVGWR